MRAQGFSTFPVAETCRLKMSTIGPSAPGHIKRMRLVMQSSWPAFDPPGPQESTVLYSYRGPAPCRCFAHSVPHCRKVVWPIRATPDLSVLHSKPLHGSATEVGTANPHPNAKNRATRRTRTFITLPS